MADQDQRTEQPTPRRLEKARSEGQFPASREFIGAFVFLAFVWLLDWKANAVLAGGRAMIRRMVEDAFQADFDAVRAAVVLRQVSWNYLSALAAGGLMLSAATLAVQIGITRLGFSWKRLTPDLSRLDPLARLRQMGSQNLSSFLQALVLLPVLAYVLYLVAKWNLPLFLTLPRMPIESALHGLGTALSDLLWRAATLLMCLGAADLFRQNRKWMSQLRMSRQEVRDEQKESEGSPLLKSRIRRLQRDLARRRMMQQVPKATAVIVNPTHFAVAIRYQVHAMSAPKVVAKGKNWLALRIRETAIRNQVPVVENAPLAQALYGSAEVGQEIPPHLYQAVAEILAYIFRLMRGNLPGQQEWR